MQPQSWRARVLAASIATALICSLAAVPSVSVAGHVANGLSRVAPGGNSRSPHAQSRGVVNVRALPHGPKSIKQHVAALPLLSPIARRSGTLPRISGPPAPVQATVTTNPPAAQAGFQGLSLASGPSTVFDPPDPWVAVGPDHIMQVVNTSLKITDRTGGSSQSAKLVDFFKISGQPIFNTDPRVIYDSLHGRWIATEVEWDCQPGGGATNGHGYIDVAVSANSDPTGNWSLFFFTYKDKLPDYSAPGTSSDKVAFAANLFSLTGNADCTTGAAPLGVDLIVMDWTQVLHPTTFADNEYQGGTNYGTLRAAVQTPAIDPALRMVTQLVVSGHTNVDYFTVTGLVGAGGTSLAEHDLTAANVIQEFLDPQPPQQPSGNVTTVIDSRPTDAIWQNNKLTFVSTQTCTPTGDTVARDCVRVSQLNTSTATPTLAQDFLLAATGEDRYYGGIGLSGSNTLFVVWTQSSATAGDYPSSYGAYELRTDSADSISPAELLAAGQANHADGRWGDYVGVAQDPQDPNATWQGNEYASSDGHWATLVSQLKTGNGSTYVPMPPVRLLDTRSGNGLSGAFTNNTPRTFIVAGRGGVPANAVAVTGNLTVTGQTSAGYVALTVSPTSSPSTSTLNFPVKDSRANNVTIPLSATGTLSAVYKSNAGQTTQLIFDVTGYFLDDDSGATYSTVTPARLLDSRNGTGGYSTPFVSGQQRSFPVWLQGGVPNTASAVTGNLTVTGQTSAGYVTLSNVNTNAPTTSTLNFPIADTRANGVSVALTGTGSLYAVFKGSGGATVHVIFDVTGYYVPGTGGLRFFALNPGRILDGRSNLGLGGTFSGSSARTLAVAGHLGVPVGAAAITGNLTVTGQTAAGYAAMTPVPTSTPSTSTINFPKGDNRANGVAIPLSTGGSPGNTSLVYKPGVTPATTYLLLDITGYFK